MANYQFLDAYSSVLTAASSVVGSVNYPIVVLANSTNPRAFGTASTVGIGSVAVLAAAGAGLRNYVTDVFIANTGSVATLVVFSDGDSSVLGKTIAPALGGSNLIGLVSPMVTSANQPFNVISSVASSVLHATVIGYKAV